MANVFMQRKSNTAMFLLLLLTAKSYAQLDNTYLEQPINQMDSNTWGFSVYNCNYMRNTEYFTPIESGRTLFGYQVNPSVYIQPIAGFKIQAGVFLQSDFGATPVINTVIPTFTAKLSNRKNDRHFLFGTIEGALSHRLIEPLYDINSAIQQRIENGAQFKIERENLFLDTWINWQKFIEPNSPYQEQFTSGINYSPSMNINTWRFSIPVQATVFHRGGQIDKDTSNMILMVNGTIGVDALKKLQGKFDAFGLSIYGVMANERTSSGYIPYRNGTGMMGNLLLSSKNLKFMLSYWNGKDYIAPSGTRIYQSISYENPADSQSIRQLLFLRIMYQKEIAENLSMIARLEPFYDFGYEAMDMSFSLYISYRFERSLGRLAKR